MRQVIVDKLVTSKQAETLASLWDAKKFAKDLLAILRELLADKR